MKRTVLMIAVGVAAVASLGIAVPASAGFLDGMPGMSTMDLYNQNMAQFGGGWGGGRGGGGLTMGMPTTNIWQDYNRLLPQLQALQAWGHAHGMPYALPGTLGGGYGTEINGSTASSYWGDKWAHELIRGDVPIYENNGAHVTIYGDDLY